MNVSLLTILVRTSPGLFALALVAALVCGLGGAGLVMLINEALHAPVDELTRSLIPFVVVAALVMGTQAGSQALFAYLGQRCLGRLRRDIAEAAIRAPFRRLEIVGRARIRSALSDDATNIANFGIGVPILATNIVVVLGALGYLAFLSVGIFVAAVVTIALGAFGYHLSHNRVVAHLRRAGRSQDRLYGDLEALVDGAKELKLNAAKSRRFFNVDLATAIETVGRERARGLALLSISDGWGRFLFMILIGMALFARLWLAPERGTVVTGYVIAFLYLMGPLEAVLSNLPYLNLARVAIGRVEALLADLEPEQQGAPAAAFQGAEAITLTLEGVTHGYFREREEDVFTLGPIDLVLRPGETTFVVGGNGSGKTTLAKLVTGLYVAESGRILVNGESVGDDMRDAYRQLFSAVYSDFHLFESLLQAPDRALDARANEWLGKLHLDHKVSVRDGAFSTRDLSQGQRKRLALVAACLEDRPIMVFDEWAADQDPAFKEVFYRDILGELKRRGKTLVVITHDDRYFDLADRVAKLEGGRLVEIADRTAPRPQPAIKLVSTRETI